MTKDNNKEKALLVMLKAKIVEYEGLIKDLTIKAACGHSQYGMSDADGISCDTCIDCGWTKTRNEKNDDV